MGTQIVCALAVLIGSAGVARAGDVFGTVTDRTSKLPVPGATVVLTKADDAGQYAEITDEGGWFHVEVPAGEWTLTVYHVDLQVVHGGIVVSDEEPITIDVPIATGLQQGVLGAAGTYVVDQHHHGAEYPMTISEPSVPPASTLPWQVALDGPDWPVLRRRDVDAAAAALGARRMTSAPTRIDGGRRLPGAPAVALGFTHRVEAASDGAIDARTGSRENDFVGAGRIALASEGNAELLGHASITPDESWWMMGARIERDAAGRPAGQALARFTELSARGHEVSATGLYAHTATADDGWLDLRVTPSSDRMTMSAGLTLEWLAQRPDAIARAADGVIPPASIGRAAARVHVARPMRWRGHHTLSVGGELGVGRADGAPHGDTTITVGDVWIPRPRWSVALGARGEHRLLDRDAITVWQPRLAIHHGTDDDDLVWHATAERIAHVDGPTLGAWRGDASPFHDEAAAGVAWHPCALLLGAGVRARRAEELEAGAEVWAMIRGPIGSIRASWSELDRAVAATAQLAIERGDDDGDRRGLVIGATAIADPTRTRWGAALTYRAQDRDDDEGRFSGLSVGVETFDLHDDDRTARLVVGAAW